MSRQIPSESLDNKSNTSYLFILSVITLICIASTSPAVSRTGSPPPAEEVKKLGEQISTVSLMHEMFKLEIGIKKTHSCSQYDSDIRNAKSAMKRLNANTSLSDTEFNKRYDIRESELKVHQKNYKQCFSKKYKSVAEKLKLTKILQQKPLSYDDFDKEYKKLKKTYYDPKAKIDYEKEVNTFQGRQNRLILTWLEENIQEVRDFRGLDDKRISRGAWERWVKIHVDKLIETAKSYNGINNKAVIPGETITDQRDGVVRGYLRNAPLVSMVAGEGKFIQLLSGDDLPPDHRHDNPYAAMTASTEVALQKKIMRAIPHSLLPEDVLKLSLDVSDGSYPLAVMTGHAVLKINTKKGRSVIERMFARARNGKWEIIPDLAKKLKPYSSLAKKLHNLRPADDKTGDKLGPWYHGFGLLSAGAISSPEGAAIGARGEHQSKKWSWFSGEGAYNAEKEYTDRIFSDATFSLRKYNRYYDSTIPE